MSNFFLFDSKRLKIRGVEIDDLDDFPQIYQHDIVTANLLNSSKLPIEQRIKRSALEATLQSKNSFIFIAFLKEDDSFIGCCGLNNITWQNRSAHIGENIGEEYKGRGLGTELCFAVLAYAFRELNLHRIGSHILVKNKPCIKMFTKLGAKEEGVLREEQYLKGAYSNVLAMAILKNEFEALYEDNSHKYT